MKRHPAQAGAAAARTWAAGARQGAHCFQHITYKCVRDSPDFEPNVPSNLARCSPSNLTKGPALWILSQQAPLPCVSSLDRYTRAVPPTPSSPAPCRFWESCKGFLGPACSTNQPAGCTRPRACPHSAQHPTAITTHDEHDVLIVHPKVPTTAAAACVQPCRPRRLCLTPGAAPTLPPHCCCCCCCRHGGWPRLCCWACWGCSWCWRSRGCALWGALQALGLAGQRLPRLWVRAWGDKERVAPRCEPRAVGQLQERKMAWVLG